MARALRLLLVAEFVAARPREAWEVAAYEAVRRDLIASGVFGANGWQRRRSAVARGSLARSLALGLDKLGGETLVVSDR